MNELNKKEWRILLDNYVDDIAEVIKVERIADES
jgi:hypothetical protein